MIFQRIQPTEASYENFTGIVLSGNTIPLANLGSVLALPDVVK